MLSRYRQGNLEMELEEKNQPKQFFIKQNILYLPNPTVPTDIWVTLTPCSKAWTLTTHTLTFCTMTPSKPILATF